MPQVSASLCPVCRNISLQTMSSYLWVPVGDPGSPGAIALFFASPAHCFAFRCFAAPFRLFAGLRNNGRRRLIGFLFFLCGGGMICERQANKLSFGYSAVLKVDCRVMIVTRVFAVFLSSSVWLSVIFLSPVRAKSLSNTMVPAKQGLCRCSLLQPQLFRMPWPR